MLYTNINDSFGDHISFCSLFELGQAIQQCGYNLPADGLREGRDYVVSDDHSHKYNGWSNYATWETYNIVSANESLYFEVMEIAKNAKDFEYFTEELKYILTDPIEHILDQVENTLTSSPMWSEPVSQIINAMYFEFCSQVNWDELAEHFWEDREVEA